MGNAYKNLHEYDSAISWLQKALAVNDSLNDISGKNYNWVTLAEVYVLKNDLDSAEYYVRKELDGAKQINDRYIETFGIQVLGQIYLKRKDYDNSIKYFQTAYDRCRKAGSTYDDILVFVLDNFYKTYQEKRDYQQAFYKLKEHFAFQERIYTDRADKIEQLQDYYDNEQRKAKLDMLEKQSQLSEAESRQRDIVDGILIASVIAGLIFAFLKLINGTFK